MYLKHYNLEIRPFSISPDPKFLWLGEKHAEALAGLEYGILENKGFVLLTGEIGTGKTLLINSLVKAISKEVIIAVIQDPRLELIDFYNILAKKFGLNKNFKRKADFLNHFEDFLIKANDQGKKVLLIIDEAQRLKSELLDEIRVLSNIEIETKKLINIFFVGQRELKKLLLEERNRPLKQRITYNYHLVPLEKKETAAFIEHRLRVAGSSRNIFSEEAIGEIHKFSQGVPRLINIICDHSLLTGYARSLVKINVEVILECAKELQIYDDISFPSPKHSPDMEEGPAILKLDIIKQLKKSQPSKKKTLIFNETIKFLNRLKSSDHISILKVAGIASIIIILAMLISVIFSPRFENSDSALTHNTENLKAETSAGKLRSPPMIAKPDGAAQDLLNDKLYSDKVAIDNNNGKIIIPEERSSNEINKIKLQSEEDIKNLTADYEQALPVESKNADENTKDELPEELYENKVQTDSNNKDIITAIDPTNIEIANFNENIESKIESPKAHLHGETNNEREKSPEIALSKESEKEIDKGSISNSEDQFFTTKEKKFFIFFKLNSVELNSQAFKTLDNIIQHVSKNIESDITIEGYADSYGDKKFNKKLSQFRANIVEGYFIAKGIPRSKITVIGLGSDNPIGDNSTKEGREKNRRVEIKIRTKSNKDWQN